MGDLLVWAIFLSSAWLQTTWIWQSATRCPGSCRQNPEFMPGNASLPARAQRSVTVDVRTLAHT
jgi:hypothetical protein